MKRDLLVGIGLAVAGMGPALAADLPTYSYTKTPAFAAPIYNWAGLYAGLNGGGASSHNCWNLTGVTLNGAPFAPVSPAQPEGCHNATGGLVGGQVGYRWQASNWLFGVEAQGDWANLKGSNPGVLTALGSTVINQTKVDGIGLFTGQIGYAWNSVLWYVKGGGALTHDTYTGIVSATGLAFGQTAETRFGGAVGTGVEFGFAPGWSVAVEYDHLFMGNRGLTFTSLVVPGVVTRTDSIKQDVDMATVRVNYTFGGPLVSRY